MLFSLDLYHNRINEISNLKNVPNLRVLLLGRNKITKVENLDYLKHLVALDLHSNQITKIENMALDFNCLKILNLANNKLTYIEADCLYGLESLTEIDLRDNQIVSPQGLIHCHNLEKVLLSNNKINKFESIQFI